MENTNKNHSTFPYYQSYPNMDCTLFIQSGPSIVKICPSPPLRRRSSSKLSMASVICNCNQTRPTHCSNQTYCKNKITRHFLQILHGSSRNFTYLINYNFSLYTVMVKSITVKHNAILLMHIRISSVWIQFSQNTYNIQAMFLLTCCLSHSFWSAQTSRDFLSVDLKSSTINVNMLYSMNY